MDSADGGGKEGGDARSPMELHPGGETGASRGAPRNSDPHRPWRRNLRFLRPKMRTLEKISTRLPLQSPRFLLGLLRLLLADGRSQCCSRACRFWRIKPLAMAAAMVVQGMGPGEGGDRGRGAGGTGEERGGADRGSPSGKQREGRCGGVGERGKGVQSRLGPISLSTKRGARRVNAPGAQRGEPREPEVLAAASQSRRSPERDCSCWRCRSPGVAGTLSGVATATSSVFLPCPPPAREVELAASFLGTRWRTGPGSFSEGPWVQCALGRSQRPALAALGQVPPPPPPPALGFCR